MVRTFIELFGFNENMLGSKQFYEEYDRIVKMLNDEYHIEKKSTIDLAKKYNISTQRVDSIFKSIGIKPRTLSEANSNAAKRRKKYMRV